MTVCHIINPPLTQITNQCLPCHHLLPNTNPNPNLSFSLSSAPTHSVAATLHSCHLHGRHDNVRPPLHTLESSRPSHPLQKPCHRCYTRDPRHLRLLHASRSHHHTVIALAGTTATIFCNSCVSIILRRASIASPCANQPS